MTCNEVTFQYQPTNRTLWRQVAPQCWALEARDVDRPEGVPDVPEALTDNYVYPDHESPLPSTCSECGTHEYAQDVMRRQEKAIHKARAERDAARLIVHGMWSLATPTRDTVDFWNQVIMRVYDWHGVDPQDGSVALDMSAFGRALRGEALDV